MGRPLGGGRLRAPYGPALPWYLCGCHWKLPLRLPLEVTFAAAIGNYLCGCSDGTGRGLAASVFGVSVALRAPGLARNFFYQGGCWRFYHSSPSPRPPLLLSSSPRPLLLLSSPHKERQLLAASLLRSQNLPPPLAGWRACQSLRWSVLLPGIVPGHS